MKWLWIVLAVALVAFGFYIVVSKGGVLEMQQEHAVEAPASDKTGTVHK